VVETPSDNPLQLSLNLRGEHFGVVFTNSGSDALRLWDFENSWGWFSLSLVIRANQTYTIRREDRDWTKNIPSAFSVGSGEQHEIALDLSDGWWTPDPRSLDLNDQTLSIRAEYRVEPTPEASEQGVFTGAASSDWATSTPPHRWLLART
jgi:hypothetical protein